MPLTEDHAGQLLALLDRIGDIGALPFIRKLTLAAPNGDAGAAAALAAGVPFPDYHPADGDLIAAVLGSNRVLWDGTTPTLKVNVTGQANPLTNPGDLASIDTDLTNDSSTILLSEGFVDGGPYFGAIFNNGVHPTDQVLAVISQDGTSGGTPCDSTVGVVKLALIVWPGALA